MRPVSRLEFLIPIAMAASLLLGEPWALTVFATLSLVWMLARKGRGLWTWPTLIVGVVLVLLGTETVASLKEPTLGDLQDEIAESFAEVWVNLEYSAAQAIEELQGSDTVRKAPREVFEVLRSEARENLPARLTLLLLDERGEVVSWGGNGLLHEITSLVSISGGRHHISSFGAVTLAVIEAFEMDSQTWRLVAGLSLRTESFPFATGSGRSPVWTVVPAGSEIDDGVHRFSASPGPDLVLEATDSSAVLPENSAESFWRRSAALLWGLTLLGVVWARAGEASPVGATVAVGVALWLVGSAAESPLWATLLLAVSGSMFYAIRQSDRRIRSRSMGLILGAVAAVAVPLFALALGRLFSLSDLGGELWSGAGDNIARVSLALLVWLILDAAPRSPKRDAGPLQALMWISFLAAVVGASSLDRASLAIAFLVVSGAAATAWKWRATTLKPQTVQAALAVIAVLLAATGWELSFRMEQKREIHQNLLPALAPPTGAEIELLADEMQEFLSTWDVSSLAPAGVDGLSQQDLAFEIWSRSPLSRYGGLSALRVLPASGGRSSFSFGLPLNKESWVDWSSPLLQLVSVPAWQDAVLVGDGSLRRAGQKWAYAEFALALQPGFRRPEGREEDLAEVLLRTSPARAGTARMDLAGGQYGLFELDGQPVVSPWAQPPDLSEAVLRGGQARVATPDGPAIAFSAVGSDGVRVVFLQEMSFLEAQERVGSHALPALLVLSGLVLAGQLPRWSRKGFKASWFHLWHSYSRRLALVYSILLLLPLGIINFVVIRAFEERLVAEQEVAGLLAVESAQGVLGEHILALEPGFGIDAALDDELLNWLSSVVHHDVNLYWRGLVYASSKRELFTAGLLSRRIPGEIYSGLTHLGHSISMRTNRAGRSEYLELYAPLTVPGISFDQTRLIVSLPMLAQQEATAEQIESLRRRSLLGSAAAILLIVALGIRLARRFTAPLTDIVEGTQRIAAGEASLDLRPSELELATLVDAIDDMASRIHAARQDLLTEKRVVDRVVENITSGVVSLDENQRVVMANRVAGEMLGLEVGLPLNSIATEDGRLAPVSDFVANVTGGKLSQRTISLRDPEGEEKEWTLVWVPLPGEAEPSALLVLEDVTEVLEGQRLQAWAEMARMIAHEIKNPLTPIRLSAEHMKEVHESDPEDFDRIFESCTTNILSQVDELQEIASEFSTYSRIPTIDRQRNDLIEVVRGIVDGYQSSAADEVVVEFEADQDEVSISCDAKLVGRAVRNLLENAVRAAPKGSRVRVSVGQLDRQARIVVADSGPGVGEALLARIFDPYFSTHDSGTGLGLPIARRIAEEHGGQISARNRDSCGLEVTITLPAG